MTFTPGLHIVTIAVYLAIVARIMAIYYT